MNKAIKAIMEKNNIKLTDKKVFRDEYLNGAGEWSTPTDTTYEDCLLLPSPFLTPKMDS